jgi:streptomycin 6-kinase
VPIALPPGFIQTTLDLFGARGQAWLDGFPELIAGLERDWSVRVLAPFPLSYNFVAEAARADGSEAVLKTWLVHPDLVSEMEALRLWDGRGIARLLECDPARGAMLLERLRPGEPLATLEDDQQATLIAAGVMAKLWIPAPPDPEKKLCYAGDWARGLERLRATFGDGVGPFPARLVEAAERLFAELLAGAGPPLLLHGDLHHWNILSAGREPWLALDPKGLVGEAEYEPGALLRNRFPSGSERETARFTARRLDLLSERLGLDRRRALGWAMAQAVLSAWWTYEDHHRAAEEMLYLAGVLLGML